MTITLRRTAGDRGGFKIIQIDGSAFACVDDDTPQGWHARVDDEISDKQADLLAKSGAHVVTVTRDFKYQ